METYCLENKCKNSCKFVFRRVYLHKNLVNEDLNESNK